MIGLVSLLFAFLFFLGLYAGLSVYLQRRREVSQRIQQYAGYQPAAVRKTPFWEILRNRFHELFAERNRRPGRPWNRKKLDLMMIQAGLPLLGKEYVAIAGGLAVLVFLVTALMGRSLVTGLLGGILAIFGSLLFLKRRISRRKEAFERQLADCLTLVSNSLRAGFSFLQTMEIISREFTRQPYPTRMLKQRYTKRIISFGPITHLHLPARSYRRKMRLSRHPIFSWLSLRSI